MHISSPGFFSAAAARSMILAGVALSLASCATIAPTVRVEGERFADCVRIARYHANSEQGGLTVRRAERGVDLALSCMLGPVPRERTAEQDRLLTRLERGALVEADLPVASELFARLDLSDRNGSRLRRLRGHVLTALLSTHGAFNHTGRVDGLINLNFRTHDGLDQDARDLQEAIYNAELGLRRASDLTEIAHPSWRRAPRMDFAGVIANETSAINRAHETGLALRRVLAVATVGRRTITPTVRRARDRIASLAAGGSNRRSIFEATLGALGKLAVLEHFAGAYLADARSYLQVVHESGEVTAAHWAPWSRLIARNCAALSAVSGTDPKVPPYSCLPDLSKPPAG